MSKTRSIRRKMFRQDATLDTLEGLGKLPNTKSMTLALAGNTFSGARRRMAEAARLAALRGDVKLTYGKTEGVSDEEREKRRAEGSAEQARLDAEYEP